MLHIKNISVSLDNEHDNKIILDNVSLDAPKGEFISIIGSNGSGKSTLLSAISGQMKVSEGSIIIDGKYYTNMSQYERARNIAKVIQNPSLGTFGDMTIFENLSFAITRHSGQNFSFYNQKAKQEFFKEKLSDLDMNLENRIDEQVKNLSGGQRQALSLLMATISPSKVLLLDEHTAALDPKTADMVMELTEKIIRTNNLTALMVTHNLSYAVKYGDRIIVIKDGVIAEEIGKDEKAKITPGCLYDRNFGI